MTEKRRLRISKKMAEKVTKVFKPKEIINKEEAQALEDLLQWQKEFQKEVKEEVSEIEKLRFKDITERLKGRQKFANFLMMLLVFQNIVVFGIFGAGMWFGKILGLENLFSILIGGTLAETTTLIYIIVKFLFSDIPYQEKKFN